MRYIIPLVNGSYTEGDSAIVTEGTRNDSSTHKFIVAVNGAPQGGKITIQSKSPGRSNWSEVDYTFLSEVNPQTIEYTGEISQYRFIVQDVSGSGSVIISDTEEGEAITPFGMFGATGGMTPQEMGDSLRSGRTAKSRTEMKAITGLIAGDVVYLSEGGRSGTFEYLVGDYSAKVTADTEEGVYVALDSDPDGSEGVLKRVLNGYVTPAMFGGGESGFKAALSSGYNVKDGESEYTITSLATLPNDKVVALVAVTGANAENVRYASNGSDTTLIAVDIDCTSGIALHQNQPNSMDQITALSKIKSDGYAFLSNNNSDGSDGYILALNYLHSEDADAVELNHPDENSSHFSTIGNIVETGNSSTSGTAGFGVGIAGTQGHITALNHCRLSRNEAYHMEDGQRRGVMLGNTGLTELHGILVLPPKLSDGEAHGPMVVGNHLEEVTGIKTGKRGLYCVWNADGSIEHPVFIANHVDGFERGFEAGENHNVAAYNIFKDVEYGVAGVPKSKIWGDNFIRGECVSFARLNNRSWCGKITSDTTPTGDILDFVGNTSSYGAVLKGFNFPISGTHPGGSSTEIMAITPVVLDGNTRLSGKLMITNTGFNYSVVMIDIYWNGTTLTTSNMINKSNGGMTSTNVIASSGYMAIQAFSTTSLDTDFTVDFEGYYYQEA